MSEYYPIVRVVNYSSDGVYELSGWIEVNS